MKTCLATLLGGLLCQAASAQCLSASATSATSWVDAWLGAAADPGHGLWLAALGLMAGIAWRRQGH